VTAKSVVIIFKSLLLRFAGNGEEQLEFWWKFVFSVKSVWEVNSADTAIGVYLNSKFSVNNSNNYLPKCFNIVGTICTSCEVWQVELNLIPAFVKSHGHSANEGFDTSGALIIWSTESSTNVLIVKYLDFESEILFQLHKNKG